MSHLGERISQLRRSKGLTQEQLGMLLNVSAQAVSKWEKGDSLPDITLLPKLADQLECTADFLLGRESSLRSILPQIRVEIQQMTPEQKINFLGKMIEAVGKPAITDNEAIANPLLTHIHLSPVGLGLWAKDRFVCIATSMFLHEAAGAIGGDDEFPMNILPTNVKCILPELLLDNRELKPDFQPIEESVLRSCLPENADFDKIITDCIELGFVERVRGGYRLSVRGDIATRLFSIVHRVVSKPGSYSLVFSDE